MLSLALTGGIATGKSTFARLFCEMAPETCFFDSDAVVHELLTKGEVVATVTASLGQNLTSADGTLNRSRLRELVFEHPDRRKTLEGILHPLVRAACAASQQQARAAGVAAYFLADVPLLYESGFPLQRDLDVVVACGPATQRHRLMERSGFAPDLAEQILAAQLPIAEKMDRADTVLWNGGEPESLRRQTEHFLLWLKNKKSKS
ncbi:MAG TPA: dephospho-CoA kinase [Verrucomicrobiales bacterium]|jgi:dephospho-CoA kinase|nr:dephospho-CoA kinase [Verrucomicrobiales bacterium]